MTSPSSPAASPVRTYKLAEGFVVGGLVNGVLNALLGYLLIPVEQLPMFWIPGVAPDIVGMAFGIAFVTSLLLAPQMRKRRDAGTVAQGRFSRWLGTRLRHWPTTPWARATRWGLWCTLLFAPPAVLALWLADVESLSRLEMTWLKGVFAAVVGAALTPAIAVDALNGRPDTV